MKYTNKFEEMIESRIEAIDNLKKVSLEQIKLVNLLTSTEESKKDFSELIKSLNETISKNEKDIELLISANKKTEEIIKKCKKCDEKTSKFIEDILEEIGIFNETKKES